jgi:predicted nucleic acid-binding protein
MRFTIDASVHINALNRSEESSASSRDLFTALHRPLPPSASVPHEVFVPTLLLIEIAASVARIFDDTDRGIRVADAVLHLPHQTWVPIGGELTAASWRLAAQSRLRGADAVYGAVAERYGAILITLDRQQLGRLASRLTVWTPEETLRRIGV